MIMSVCHCPLCIVCQSDQGPFEEIIFEENNSVSNMKCVTAAMCYTHFLRPTLERGGGVLIKRYKRKVVSDKLHWVVCEIRSVSRVSRNLTVDVIYTESSFPTYGWTLCCWNVWEWRDGCWRERLACGLEPSMLPQQLRIWTLKMLYIAFCLLRTLCVCKFEC